MQKTPKRILRKETSLQLPPINKKSYKKQERNPNLIKSEPIIDFKEEKPFEFITQNAYVSKITRSIHHLANLFKISTGLALNLLLKSQYNVEESYALAFDFQKNKNNLTFLNRLLTLTDSFIDIECPVCYQSTNRKEMLSLCCDHKVCKTCYHDYLINIMNDEGIAKNICL